MFLKLSCKRRKCQSGINEIMWDFEKKLLIQWNVVEDCSCHLIRAREVSLCALLELAFFSQALRIASGTKIQS